MNLGIHGKVAAVAAASKGLGKAVALELAKEGASVAICSRDKERIEAAAQDIARQLARPDAVVPIVADVSTSAGCRQFIANTVSHFGTLDILVTNGGGPPSAPAPEITDEQWEAATQLTLLSNVHMVYAALPHLKESGQGRVIAITSFTAKQPLENLVLSNTLRAGVLGFMKSMATELGHTGITFNTVLPGWTKTERVDQLLASLAQVRHTSPAEVEEGITRTIPASRMAQVEEFAVAVAFLASERASYINGVALQIDGGIIKGLF